MTTLNDPISVEEKRARLAQLLREKASQRSYPLSFSQERLWFLEQLEPNSPLYNLFTVLRLRGPLNVAVLTQAVNELVKRHESLRTVFVTDGEDRPAQRILPTLTLTLPIVDMREKVAEERESESRRLIQEEAQAPFNLAEGPLLRARLVRLGDEDYLALLNMHHIITDGWSVNLFIGEMAALYHAFSQGQPSPLRPIPMKYADFATWQRQQLQGDFLDQQITYWKEQLAGAPPLLELPTDHPRPPVQRNHGANHHFTLPPSLVAELKQFSQQEGVTLFMTLLATWKVLLYRYSGQSDVVVGSPIANRTRTELEGLMGFFVNTLVFRTDVEGNPTFRELVQRVKQTALGAYNHQDLPFEQLVEAVKPPRTLSYSPLFQVMFVLQNTPKSTLKVAGLTVQQEEIESTIAKFDITLVLADSQQGITGTLEYNRDLFDPATIARLCDHFQVLIQGIVATPDRQIATLPLLTTGEKVQLLTHWNETGRDFPQEHCWHEAFTAQVERTPDRVAVVYGEHYLNYAALNDRANQLAHYLQALGVGPDKIVGLYLERSVDLVVGLLAILKAGGAYLPLDPTYPAERIQTMLADAKPAVVLTRQALMDHLPEYAGYFVCLDRNTEAIAQFSTATPPTETTPDNLAYLIYTSGSTGKPKGVMVRHRSVMNLAYALNDAVGTDGDRLTVSVNGSVSFDTSVKQLVQVVHGHTLDITPQEIRFDGEALLEYLRSHHIDLFDCTPSQLRVVIESNQQHHTNLPAKAVLIGGEAIDQTLWDELAKAERTAYYNVYGPTECTVDSTVSAITPETDPTIGRPIANTHLYVLDSHKHPVPIGIAGELYIGGSGVARGYFRHPAATAEKFIPDPFSNEPGARLYKTGDLVRYRANGTLEFIGRADDQVKIRGYRIELGEIESVLAQHPAVQAAAVLAHEGQSGGKQLVAYVQMGRRTQDAENRKQKAESSTENPLISPAPKGRGTETSPPNPLSMMERGETETHPLTPSEEGERNDKESPFVSGPVPLGRGTATPLQSDELRGFLQQRLPDYMVPTAFMLMEALPLTPNGKINRRALKEIAVDPREIRSRRYVAPRTPIESQLADIWESILGISQVGVEDNFFEIGGHSLLATQLASRVRTSLQTEFPLRLLFETPTIAEMAQRLTTTGNHYTQPIPPRPVSVEVPLSFAQERLWFLDQLEPGSPFYNIPAALRLKGKLNVEVLERAFNTVIARHETLRTYFPLGADGKPIQAIHPTLTITIEVEAIRDIAVSERERIALEKSSAIAQAPFKLAEGPLLRIHVLQLADDEHLALLTLHHIITDGWSTNILISELATLYEAFVQGNAAPLSPLSLHYSDFALWQREWLQGDILEQQVGYWKKQLKGIPPLLEIPTDHPRPAIQTFRGAHVDIEIPAPLTNRLKKLSQQEGVTLFMTLLAAWNVLLYRYSGQTDVVVGSPIANRTRTELETIIGFFVNTLVLRSDLSQTPSFRTLLQQVRETTLSAYSHQDLPFEQIVEAVQPERNLSHSPLFQVMFVLQNTPRTILKVGGLTVENTPVESGIAKFDLTLTLAERGQALVGSFEYNSDLFDRSTIERLRDHFHVLLQGIITTPANSIAALPLLPPAEWQQVVHGWNENGISFDRTLCIHQWFEAQVTRTPTAIALVDGEQRLTYRELHERANQLAHHLQSLGVKPEQFVGVCMRRSATMLVGMVGILKAGGAYAPLDPAYPAERLAYIVENARVQVILTEESLLTVLPPTEATIICVDQDSTTLAQYPATPPKSDVTARHLAYVIYTSGSTGRPKGVAITHANAGAMLAWAADLFTPEEVRGMLASTSINFDISVYELFLPLSIGGTVILAENLLHLPTLAAANEVTLVNTVPSVLSEYLKVAELPVSVQTVNLAGEPLPLRLVQQVYSRPHVQKVYNLYGPSEDTTYSTWALIEREESRAPSIGRPIANTQLYLLDPYFQPVPIGVAGEIYLGGEGVAQGYLHRPALTAEKFIPDPFGGVVGSRLYGTGDLARYRPDGTVEYLGRRDHQVKVRGFRIELGEIEAVVAQHPSIQAVAVMVREDVPGDKRLVAYVVESGKRKAESENDKSGEGKNGKWETGNGKRDNEPAPQVYVSSPVPLGRGMETSPPNPLSGEGEPEAEPLSMINDQLSIEVLRQFVQRRLPAHMVPSAWVILEALPLTPNGKVDRRALPAPDQRRTDTTPFIAPHTPTEEMVASLWAELLQVDQIGREDNFFVLGGHSLLATRVIARLRAIFTIELPLRALFEAPTVAGLAAHIESAPRASAGQAPLRSAPRGRELPLSFAQERLWFLDQLEPNSPFYNILIPLRLRGALDVARLTAALNTLIARHETLRTVFLLAENGAPVQQILPNLTITPTFEDISTMPDAERESEIQRLATRAVQQPFTLSEGPLLRAHILQTEAEEHIALLTMHHIITDGWSWNIVVSEIATLYQVLGQGAPSPLPELPLHYADFALWQREWLQGERLERLIRYWKNQLAEAPPLLELPTDRPRPPVQSFRGTTLTFDLPLVLTESLKQLSHQEGATLFMTLLAAFKVLLYRHSGQSDLVIGTPIANRTRTELEGLIGFFVNTLVLRTDLAGSPSFIELLHRVRESTLEAYTHQELPFEQVVEAVQPSRTLSHSPIFQVMFTLQNMPKTELQVEGLSVQAIEMESAISKFDLTLTLMEQPTGVHGIVEYNTDLFDPATILRFSDHFQTLLMGIIANPTQPITTLPLFTEQEWHHLLTAWNNTQRDYPRDLLVPHRVEGWAERSPTALAVAWDGGQLSYSDLNRRANQLARYLQSCGVGVESPVAVCLPRSPELAVGLLAILKAGGAYLPLDPAYPPERLAWMVADSHAPLLLTSPGIVEPASLSGVKIIHMEAITSEIAAYPDSAPPSAVKAENLAYIIYTSGSTGTPKGTMLSHDGLLNLVHWHQRAFDITARDRATWVAGVGFDASVWELWPYLTAGASIHLPDEESRAVPQQMQKWLVEEHLTVAFLPTPLAERVLPLAWEPDIALRILLTGGDRLTLFAPPDLPFTLVNNYGPTENTVVTTSIAVPADSGAGTMPSIGYPIDNGYVYLLDAELAPVPLGGAGELHIGGVGLARGYLNRPALSAERFIPDPFSATPGARLYKTGDLARYRTDGSIEFLGRIDHQVKIRGFRIELGEIETLLSHHPMVQETVVIVRDFPSSGPCLVGYIVPSEEGVTGDALRQFLEERLPDYMIPTAWVMLPLLPLTPNGKVDRHALPAPDDSRVGDGYVPPRTPLEAQLATLWAEVLGARHVSVHANFFALGGYSLLAVQLIARIEQRFGVRLPLAMLFREPTIERLARLLGDAQTHGATAASSSLVPLQQGNTGRTPLFLIHPVGGNSFAYMPLVAHLDSGQPVYGLQSQGLEGEAPPHATIEEMAAHYITQLRTVQPEGPYQLGGWSMGGVIAYEMAQQLRSGGQTVSLVAMIDSHVPDGMQKAESGNRDSVYENEMALLTTFALDMGIPMGAEPGSLELLAASTVEERLAFLVERAKRVAVVPPDIRVKQVGHLFAIFRHNVTALAHYNATPYRGAVTLLRAEESLNGNKSEDATLGWGTLITDGLTLHSVPGNHFTMVRPPHVALLAQRLSDDLD